MDRLFTSLALLAEGEQPGGGGMLSILTMFLPLLLLWLFLIEGPRRKQSRQRDEMLKGLKKNDRVITAGGIFGVVTNIQADSGEVTIRVDETNNTRLRVTLTAIDRVLSEEPEPAAETTEKK